MNHNSKYKSIFEEYYAYFLLKDRYLSEPEKGATVIIPVLHTNELWEANLHSIYREIPVAELILSDGGCVDNTIEIAKKFPRVRILDHRHLKSLGYSIRMMIEEVKTDWFLYLHSDVYLPGGWFNEMEKNKDNFDWYGTRMRHTVMVEYDLDYGVRPWAGTQMGRTSKFIEGIKRIDDDYVYRQEDFVFSDIVASAGGKEGKIENAYHYHQTMRKPSPTGRQIKDVKIEVTMKREEEVRTWETQMKGIVKYFNDTNHAWLKNDAIISAYHLIQLKAYSEAELYGWIRMENSVWLPVIKTGVQALQRKNKLKNFVKRLLK